MGLKSEKNFIKHNRSEADAAVYVDMSQAARQRRAGGGGTANSRRLLPKRQVPDYPLLLAMLRLISIGSRARGSGTNSRINRQRAKHGGGDGANDDDELDAEETLELLNALKASLRETEKEYSRYHFATQGYKARRKVELEKKFDLLHTDIDKLSRAGPVFVSSG
jgi:hypothetical protein